MAGKDREIIFYILWMMDPDRAFFALFREIKIKVVCIIVSEEWKKYSIDS